MTFSDILRNKSKHLLELADLADTLSPDCDIDDDFFGRNLIIRVSSLDNLHKIRTLLRSRLGAWSDSCNQIWASDGYALASFVSEKEPRIAIWLRTPLHDFPSELMKDGCHFQERLTKSYRYVCDIQGE